MEENALKNSDNIQSELSIQSSEPFLYEYWKVFFYLYFRKISNKYIKTNSGNFPKKLLNSLSINNLLILNGRRIENDKLIKGILNLNSFHSNYMNNLSDGINNGIINNPNNQNLNLGEADDFKFPPISNYLDTPIFPNLIPDYNNNYFLPEPSNISNKLNISPLFNFGNDLRQTNYLNNLNNYNKIQNNEKIPYFPLSFPNSNCHNLPNSIISTNNINSNSNINNYMIKNNNKNQNINIENNNSSNIEKIIIEDEKINLNNEINVNSKSLLDNKNENNINNPKIMNYINNINIKMLNSKEKNNNKSKEDKTKQNSSQFKKAPSKIRKVFFNVRKSDPEKEGDLLLKKKKRFLKNNKLVYLQMEQNEYNIQNEQRVDYIYSVDINNNKPRASKFRGVSKNGNQWQVLIMVNKKKRYLGSFLNEEEAARVYDKVALQNHGHKAKTNFDYTKEEIDNILKSPKLLKFE